MGITGYLHICLQDGSSNDLKPGPGAEFVENV